MTPEEELNDDDIFMAPDEEPSAVAGKGDEIAEAGEAPDAAGPSALEAELATVRAELEETRERFLRKAADLENARRRHQREKDEYIRYAAESVLKEIVPVLDDLQRAVAHMQDADAGVREGVEMVSRKFEQTLSRQGVVAVQALGAAFDPQYHEAIQQREDTTVPHNTVVQEFQRGYLLHDRLLRPSLVVVAQGGPARELPAEAAAQDAADGETGTRDTEG